MKKNNRKKNDDDNNINEFLSHTHAHAHTHAKKINLDHIEFKQIK